MAVADLVENAREAFGNLNERERKLVMVLGAVLAVILVVLPIYFITASISDLERSNQRIADVLRDIDRERPNLAQRQAEREAAMARYRTPAPPLGSFVEAKAREQELSLREVNDQPEKVMGEYTRRHVRATMPNVGLRPVVKMITEIENSPYPVAIERIQIEHFRAGDRYNVQLGVLAFDSASAQAQASNGVGERAGGRAGPPVPGGRR